MGTPSISVVYAGQVKVPPQGVNELALELCTSHVSVAASVIVSTLNFVIAFEVA